MDIQSKKVKAITDIILIAIMILSFVIPLYGTEIEYWQSPHCIILAGWFIVILLHIWQHWKMIKALARVNVMKRNKITVLTTIAFCFMTISIMLLIADHNHNITRYHSAIGHIFLLIVLIHFISKINRLYNMLRK